MQTHLSSLQLCHTLPSCRSPKPLAPHETLCQKTVSLFPISRSLNYSRLPWNLHSSHAELVCKTNSWKTHFQNSALCSLSHNPASHQPVFPLWPSAAVGNRSSPSPRLTVILCLPVRGGGPGFPHAEGDPPSWGPFSWLLPQPLAIAGSGHIDQWNENFFPHPHLVGGKTEAQRLVQIILSQFVQQVRATIGTVISWLQWSPLTFPWLFPLLVHYCKKSRQIQVQRATRIFFLMLETSLIIDYIICFFLCL